MPTIIATVPAADDVLRPVGAPAYLQEPLGAARGAFVASGVGEAAIAVMGLPSAIVDDLRALLSGGLTLAFGLTIANDASGTLADLSGDPAWADWPYAVTMAGTMTVPGGTIAVTITALGVLAEVTPGQWSAAMATLLVSQAWTPVITITGEA